MAEIVLHEYIARRRTGEAQAHFLNGIERLIMQLWKRIQIHEGFMGGVNKRTSLHP